MPGLVLNPGFIRPPTPFRPVDVIPGSLGGSEFGSPLKDPTFDAHKNFVYSTIATPPNPTVSGTTLTVATGDGQLFPTPPFNASVWPAGAQPLVGNGEIVRVTAIAGDVLTILRGQEGTVSRQILVGDQIAVTITAKSLTDVEKAATTFADGDYYGVVAAAKTGATQSSRYVGATASGAPVAGTFQVGDAVIDQSGGIWICTVAGSPGTWAPAIPAGSITNAHVSNGAAIQAAKIAAGSGPGVLLSDTTLGGAGTFDVSSISQSYIDLIFVLDVLGTGGGGDSLHMRLNNDSGGNYGSIVAGYTGGTTVTAVGGSASGDTSVTVGPIASNASTTFAQLTIELLGYTSTAWVKRGTILGFGSNGSVAPQAFFGGFLWSSTSAVNRAGFFGGASANLATSSRLRIYGR